MNGAVGGGAGNGDGSTSAATTTGEENSQAEGAEGGGGAVGGNRGRDNPHYENIYERVAGGDLLAPNHNGHHQAVVAGVAAAAVVGNCSSNCNMGSSRGSGGGTQSLNRRNVDMYGYDVVPAPGRNRQQQGQGAIASGGGMMRRANLHLDLSNSNAPGGGAGGRGGRYARATAGGGSLLYQQSMPIYGGGGGQQGQLCPRQHSFDDTESAHYHQVVGGAGAGSLAGGAQNPNNYANYRYENLYEQIHEEPIYRNVSVNSAAGTSAAAANKMYGRLDVIGHGIGRIERHLSSSCGNIDHYNLGGHYAVMGHSHLGAVGHIRMNRAAGEGGQAGTGAGAAAAVPAANKDPNVKSSYSSFFNCLSKENSQSMMNMEKSGEASGIAGNALNGGGLGPDSHEQEEGAVGGGVENPPGRQTGAIPKVNNGTERGLAGPPSAVSTSCPAPKAPKGKTTEQTPDQSIYSSNSSSMSLNKITKSSMQWLMMNKWLPLWMGQGSDCRVVDFNFMFSRKCEGCGENCRHTVGPENDEELLQFATDDERNVLRSYGPQPAQFWTPHPTHRTLYGVNGWNDGRLSLRREQSLPGGGGRGEVGHDQRHYDVPRATGRFAREQFLQSNRNLKPESPNVNAQRMNGGNWGNVGVAADPFRNWELNTENNTFKPANNRVQDVRRITDGTYRKKEMKEPRDASRVGQPSQLAATSSGQTLAQGGWLSGFGKFKFVSQGSETEADKREGAEGEKSSESEDSSSGGTVSSCSPSTSESKAEDAVEDQEDGAVGGDQGEKEIVGDIEERTENPVEVISDDKSEIEEVEVGKEAEGTAEKDDQEGISSGGGDGDQQGIDNQPK